MKSISVLKWLKESREVYYEIFLNLIIISFKKYKKIP